MIIRRCEDGDLESVMDIERESFPFPYSQEIFEDYLSSDHFLVAEEDGDVIGYILGEKREGQGVIVSIAVSSDRRHEGVGTSLMERVMDQMDVERFFLIVRLKNRGAQLFYEELGFSKITTIEDYYLNGDTGILMQKEV
ncbi:MAG: ribosomal protein S18-alanine N-acetyltransferase [Thermoplasmata archaeon]